MRRESLASTAGAGLWAALPGQDPMWRIVTSALAVLVTVPTIAAAQPDTRSIPLPDDFAPEGIAIGKGATFYVGSLKDGDIYRGNLRSGAGSVFINAPAGRQAGGLKVEKRRHRLWVAGGVTGHGYVYDTRTGKPLADLRLTGQPSLVNDVVVTKRAAYFTDSLNPVLYKVPIGARGRIGTPETLRLSGPAATIMGFPNLNGIAATRNGKKLIVAHSNLPALLTVDPKTGASRTITLTGGSLTRGTPDGILLDGRTLWVVENFAERLVEIRLSRDLSSGRIVSVRTDELFRIPTTVAKHGHKLAIVNGRFDQGLPPPLGQGAPAGTDYDVVVIPKHTEDDEDDD